MRRCAPTLEGFEWWWSGCANVKRGAAAAAASAATLAVFVAADTRTVDSFYSPVSRLDVLPEPARRHLAASGLRSPEALLRALRGKLVGLVNDDLR